MDYTELTHEKLDLDAIYNLVSSPKCGAVSVFVGTTRDNFEERKVTQLEYEAYEGMAVKSMQDICKKIREKFEVGNIAIYHRLGTVPIKEASVIIAISSAHRKGSLEAVPYAIDSLKANVPIWKKEMYEDERLTGQWKENSESKDLIVKEVEEEKQMDGVPETVQLYEEEVETQASDIVPPDMIQIRVGAEEINRRIASFINRKRQQVNMFNIQSYCERDCVEVENEFSCARVDAVVLRCRDSKSHFKVHRVENLVGPQTHGYDPGSGPEPPPPPPASKTLPLPSANCPQGAEERLANAEQFLGISSISTDVFHRLKLIEDRLLYLESVSPEYLGILKLDKPENAGLPFKRTSTLDREMKLQRLESKLLG